MRNRESRRAERDAGAVAIALVACGALLQGCGGGSSSTENPTPGPVPVDTWTLSGTVQFPADETATQLKLAAAFFLSYDTSVLLSDPVALAPTGTPPTAEFSLSIDPARAGIAIGNIVLRVWRDADGDGVLEFLEPIRGMDPVVGDAVWCDAGACPPAADFTHLRQGQSGYDSVYGSWSIATTGWYYDRGCSSHACAELIVGPLTGARIGYWEYGGAIVPAP